MAALVCYSFSDDYAVMTGSLIDFDQTISGANPE